MKKIIANLINKEESRIAIIDERGKLCDFFVERGFDGQHTGEIYKAKVDNVLVGMNAAFVNLGDGKNGFLYLAESRGTEIKQGMDILVQLAKNARKGKNARVTTKISLAGHFHVLVPEGRHIGVSKRIEDESERIRLRNIVRHCKPDNFGVIIRTAATGVSEESLTSDINEMLANWQKIKKTADTNSAPCLVHKEAVLLERVLRDELTDAVDEVIVDTAEDYETVKTFVKQFLPNVAVDVTCYGGSSNLFDIYSLEQQIALLEERKVWLSSGAYLVIDQTEALTVIDVNTGKFVGGKNLDDTVFKTNLEAAKEIARQLRVRSIGGIVVIDFIDMAGEDKNRQLIEEIELQLKVDKSKARVFGVTGLGLVEITRKRSRLDIRSELMRCCPFCQGNGVVEKEENMAMKIKRFTRKVCLNTKAETILVECHNDIARYITESVLADWEKEFKKEIVLCGRTNFAWNKYKLDFQGRKTEAECRIDTLKKEECATRVYRSSSA